MLGVLTDGTAYFAPPGELPFNEDSSQVQCHLCGRYWRALGAHLRYSHGWSVDRYRKAFDLNRSRPLQGLRTSRLQEQALRRRMAVDERLLKGMALGHRSARSGALRQLALADHQRAGRPLERRRTDRAVGRRLGSARAGSLRAQREALARAVGHTSLEDLLRARYERDGVSVAVLARELRLAETTVAGDMERLGIPRRSSSQRLAAGRATLRAQRAEEQEELQARARSFGFTSLAAYLTDRHHARGWRRADIAAELGLPANRSSLARIMAAEGVAGNPAASARREARAAT